MTARNLALASLTALAGPAFGAPFDQQFDGPFSVEAVWIDDMRWVDGSVPGPDRGPPTLMLPLTELNLDQGAMQVFFVENAVPVRGKIMLDCSYTVYGPAGAVIFEDPDPICRGMPATPYPNERHLMPFYTSFGLDATDPPGNYRFALTVRDMGSGRRVTVETTMDIVP
ncbi:hypothetical protein [Pseudoroseicyclus tamaricis]|uniref:Uncharacterized protein n=1 Tax=Pseudoroseicyclus tamaricis TaxID=2705421 RepID=A0A6B2JT30_9RHOB|nr:hypothetical protein [Pseudoroseicyclus tamaricis]NDU99718.1 hypothetical protein [Pseudoroseicyclus tamaricis]